MPKYLCNIARGRVSTSGDFLELRGLLAADTIAGLEGLDVAHFAEIMHSVELPILDGV
jgi:hypothetical protein